MPSTDSLHTPLKPTAVVLKSTRHETVFVAVPRGLHHNENSGSNGAAKYEYFMDRFIISNDMSRQTSTQQKLAGEYFKIIPHQKGLGSVEPHDTTKSGFGKKCHRFCLQRKRHKNFNACMYEQNLHKSSLPLALVRTMCRHSNTTVTTSEKKSFWSCESDSISNKRTISRQKTPNLPSRQIAQIGKNSFPWPPRCLTDNLHNLLKFTALC